MRLSLVLLAFSLTSTAAPGTFNVDDLLHVANVGIADISPDGRWVAVTVSTLEDRIGIDNHRFGDPTYIAPNRMDLVVFDTQTGASQKVFPQRTQVRALKWSPDGTRLAMLALRGDAFEARIWERSAGKFAVVAPPSGRAIDDSGEFFWSPDGARLIFPLRAADWRDRARARFRAETEGPVIFHSTQEPFLAWIELRRMSLDRSVASLDLASKQVNEIAPSSALGSYRLAEDGTFLVLQEDIGKKTDYETLGAGEARVDLLALAAGAKPRTLIASTKDLTLIWSTDTRHYAYSKQGAVYFGSIDDKEPRLIAGKKQESKDAKEEKPKDDRKDSFTAVRLSPRGDRLVASNKEGLWLIDTGSGSKDLFVKMPEEDKTAPRYQAIEWSPSGDAVYLTYSSRTKWERGLCRYDIASKKLEDLKKDGRIYPNLHLSHDGRRWVYLAAQGNHPAEVFTADASLREERRLADFNPQLRDKALSKTELISYLDADGKKEFGVLYYPAGYEAGKKYPTVFNIYEQFYDDTFTGTLNILTANGYAVVQPSVEFETGFPGEAWLKGVTAAANKVIEMGVADPDKLGVQGQSYGGYATNLLITQTNRFKAAINISGKVNMISFYTDSPRLGVRNIHAPEHSQDRLGATLWQQPQKYVQQSAIFYADRIKTPLLLMCGEQDHNVPPRQLMEMYYALRRLGKEVAWADYVNGGHGMPTSSVEEVRDFHQRILTWYDDHLKKEPKKADTETASQ